MNVIKVVRIFRDNVLSTDIDIIRRKSSVNSSGLELNKSEIRALDYGLIAYQGISIPQFNTFSRRFTLIMKAIHII